MCESNPCQDFFSRREDFKKDFWSDLDSDFPDCQCEAFRVSEFSPGIIENQETLLAVITSEGFVSDAGKVEPTFFETRMATGFSTDRKQFTTQVEYDERAAQLKEINAERENYGSIEISVEGIRSVTYSDKRAVAVYDTGLKENPSHAEIVMTAIPPKGTKRRKRIRSELRREILNACLHEKKVLPSSEIFADK